jgi:OTU domain-containing protein 6
MEELQARHRKEQRELQGLITQKKKSASKKLRKGVNDECAKLEAELGERQGNEIAELGGGAADQASDSEEGEQEELEKPAKTNGAPTDTITNGVSSLVVEDDHEDSPTQPAGGKKRNRQKERLARRAAEREEEVAKATKEAANMPDLRAKEQEIMEKAMKAKGLHMKAIRADGHCLYSAVADQLNERQIGLRPRIRPDVVQGEEPYRTVRRTTAAYIAQNKDDFEPFLEESLDTYVRKVGETAEWGGQLELTALAKVYEVDIGVLDGNGGVHEIDGSKEKDDKSRKIWLAYYRHGFGLGEHYNSLRKVE